MKRIILKALLVLTLALGFNSIQNVASDIKVEAAVKNPSVKEAKKTLYMGGSTYQIKLSNLSKTSTVTYKSSNKKIASVTTKGVVKPVAIGTAVISASVKQNKRSYTLKVNITVKHTPVLSSKEIYSQCGPSTVEISTKDEYDNEGLGSGFFLGNGKIVTNYHVIEGANKIVVKTYDKKEYEVKTILGYDENIDIAVLEIDDPNKGLTLSQDKISVGDNIYTLGSPLGLTGTMTKGMVSTASRIIDSVDYIQIDASISPGNSGGPLVNEYGQVIGINTMYFVDGQNLNFAININELSKVVTNNPMTVADYVVKYNKEVEEEFNKNIIYEDSKASQNITTSQEIPAGVGVKGTLKSSEQGDCYYFNVTEPGYFYGILKSDNLDDFKNTYFELYTYNAQFLSTCYEMPDDLCEYISYYLTPGEYIIYVSPSDNYSGNDINYTFVLLYD